ncbi:MAG: Ig-like domain-containing protein [Clostridia bacterium]|nr:Ig-like domain-containing protein [Clostridia bacterium]
MRKVWLCLLCLTLLLSSVPSVRSEGTFVLPLSARSIEDAAFMDNAAVQEVVIQENVEDIGSQAFSGCVSLSQVTFLSRTVSIAKDAFAGCPNVRFQVYPDSTAELYALSHGLEVSYLDAQKPVYEQVMSLVSRYASPGSTLQGKESKRIIVRVDGSRLPDISTFNPVSIVRRSSSIYFVQFGTEDDTLECYNFLSSMTGSGVVYAEYDEDTSVIDENAYASGIMTWSNEDPMGFDTYAPYVAGVQSGSVTIAVVDSGIRSNAVYNGMLLEDSINLVGDGQSKFYDGCNHGSKIAAIIRDCAGSANVRLLSVRVVNSANKTTPSLLGMGIAYAADHGASVINLSLNASASAYVKDELQNAMQRATVVVSAGNDRIDTSRVFPANVSGAVVVSGLEAEDLIWRESNTGSQVTFCAPAKGFRTSAGSFPDSGTSFSAPMISAAYALVKLDPTHSISDMINSCKDLGTPGRDSVYGYGMPDLNVLAALQVTSIEVQDAPKILLVGDSTPLNFTVLPERALNPTVSATSSDDTVLSITRTEDEGITLTALSSGKVTVTLSANDESGVSVSLDIQVVQEVEGLTIIADSDELPMTRTLNMRAAIEPAGADDMSVLWSSSNPAAAVVDADGLVTPVAPGIAIIRCEAADGYGAFDEITLNVIEIPDAEGVEIYAKDQPILAGDQLNVVPGETVNLTAQVYPYDAEQQVTWSILAYPSSCASVDLTGKVVTRSVGTAFVTAQTPNGKSTQFIIRIMQMPESISLSGENTVKVGEDLALSASLSPQSVDDPVINWSSSDTSVAQVNQDGVVTGVGSGNAVIYAKANADETIQSSKLITVIQMPHSLKITGEVNIYAGYASKLTSEIVPENVYDTAVTWQSSQPEVATVDENGLVTAVGVGNTLITAVSHADETIADSVIVRVRSEWPAWTDEWSPDPVEATDSRQVETRKEYRYKETVYSSWSSWSAWDHSRQSIPDKDIKQEQSSTVYGWYYFLCPNCGNHNRYWGNGQCTQCGGNIPSGGSWHSYLLTQPWNAAGQSFTETEYKLGLVWSWTDSDGQSQTGTAYRYRTRTRTVKDWTQWSTTPISADSLHEVETRTTYRYRDRTEFDTSDVSEWVSADAAPENATIVSTKWHYTETAISSSDTMEGWTQNKGGWVQSGTGSVRYANFSSYPGFDKSNALYTKFNVAAPKASESATAKRTVTTAQDGYIYWHWMYSVSASAYDRVILYQSGYGPSGHTTAKYYYRYFQAYESKTNFSKTALNDGQDTNLYSWYLNQSDHTSNAESGGSWYWYRIPITKATYTDYVLSYEYTREMESNTEPTGDNVSNVVKYVRYLYSEGE